MPTIPKREYKPNGGEGKGSGMDFLINRTEVTEMQIKWQDTPCPAPPCKQAFWWASQPKPIKIKGCPK